MSEQARVLADSTALLVPTPPSPHAGGSRLVEDAARLVEEAQRLLTLAVIYERTQDVSWERIGLALGKVSRKTVSRQAAHERYVNAERDFHRRLLYAWLLPERAGELLATADHLDQIITRLNAWVSARQELREQSPTVSLAPLSTSERSALIGEAEALLGAMPDTSDVSEQEHRDLEIGLCRRKIEVYEDLAVQAPGELPVLQALVDARTRLTELLGTD
ncbi:hypothetical protein [Microbispora triticiradicis]|uniref:hypothetical protein n=1 Tax=Microbispora triticiradicis TaxID=2200763 RepID=UPI0010591726|nr:MULTISPECIES: hypothetical protein [Microbispora]